MSDTLKNLCRQTLLIPMAKETRFWFFSGKGGAGKSSMSAATAVHLAAQGHQTLILSTDPAPNLSDIFDQDLSDEPEAVNGIDNLYACELDPDTLSEAFKQKIIETMRGSVKQDELEEIKDALETPCTDEIAAFDAFTSYLDDEKFDKIVLDTAPTGNTLHLLESPFEWIQEIEDSAETCIGPSTSLTGAKEEYTQAIDLLRSDQADFVFVMRPSRSSLMETRTAIKELGDQGFTVNNLIINGYTPEQAKDSTFYGTKYDSEQEVLEQTKELDIETVHRVPLLPHEIRGIEQISDVAAILYEGKAPQFKATADDTNSHPDLDSDQVQDLLANMDRVFITGKGGSGKTTSALALAELTADNGFDTLFISVYSHGDVEHFYGNLDGTPRQIDDNLAAVKVDRTTALNHLRESALDDVKDRFKDRAVSFDEEATLDKINRQLQNPCAAEKAIKEHLLDQLDNDHDITIIDMDPTGDALKILDKLTADENGHDLVVKGSAFGITTFPEKSPVAEAHRTVTDLKNSYNLDNIFLIVNFLLPEADNAFMRAKRSDQAHHLETIQESFDMPMIGLFENPEGIEDRDDLRDLITDSI